MSAVPSLLDFDSKGHRRPLTQKEAETFILASSDALDREAMPLDAKEAFKGEMDDDFRLNVFCMRLRDRAPDTRVTPGVVLYVMCQCKNPAMVVMWAYTLHRLSQRVGLVTMERFSRAFPFGIPTEDGYRACWQAQKRTFTQGAGSDNLLDQAQAWVTPDAERAARDVDGAVTELRDATPAAEVVRSNNPATPIRRRMDFTE